MLIQPYLLVQRGNVRVSNLTVINAILFVTENGCKWSALPPRSLLPTRDVQRSSALDPLTDGLHLAAMTGEPLLHVGPVGPAQSHQEL